MANPVTDFLSSLEQVLADYRLAHAEALGIYSEAHSALLLGVMDAMRQLAEDLDQIPGPEPIPEPEQPSSRSIFGWNAGLALFWASSRPLKNKALYASIHKQGNATFDKFGELMSGNGLLPIWLSNQMAEPGKYLVQNVAYTGTANISSFELRDSADLQQFNIQLSGDCRSISVLREGDQDEHLYEPEFRARHRGAGAIRLMDLLRTNEGDGRNGNHFRVQPGNPPIIEQTITPFYAIGMAEECGGTPLWWNFHHLDSDAFIRGVCEEFNDGSIFPIYFEMSNEVWGPFPQGAWADSQPGGRYAWQNRRTRQMSAICKDVLGERAVIVIGTQCMNYGVTMQVLDGGTEGIDCLAIAPYYNWFQQPPATFADALQQIRQYMDMTVYPAIRWQHDFATSRGLRLVCYEAGSDLSWHNNPAAEPLYRRLIESHELATIYEEFMDFWEEEVGDLCLFFNDVNPHGFGAWYSEKSPPQPRGKAIMDRINSATQTT